MKTLGTIILELCLLTGTATVAFGQPVRDGSTPSKKGFKKGVKKAYKKDVKKGSV